MKIFKIAALLLLASSSFNVALGGQDRGGGDSCENRIQVIREDIKSWIHHGGAKSLNFTPGLNAKAYESKMLAALSTTKIRCVSEGDQGWPVEINGVSKECRFDKGPKGSLITCDRQKISEQSEGDQYFLVHHEYAGVAAIEKPDGDQSTYVISRQITSYLVDTVVKRLAVRSATAINLKVGQLFATTKSGFHNISVTDQTYGRTLSGNVKYGGHTLPWYAVIDPTMPYGPSVYVAKGFLVTIYDVGTEKSTQTVCKYAIQAVLTQEGDSNNFSGSFTFPSELKLNPLSDGSCPAVETQSTDSKFVWVQ